MKHTTPIIGIFGWKTGENSYGASISYIQYVNSFGLCRIITPDEPIDPEIDLIIVPGGADVDTARYGATPGYLTGKPDPIKEYQDTRILPEYIKMGTPVFGICRGIQSIAVLFGAKLIQHMNHESNTDSRSETVHSIELLNTDFRTDFIKSLERGKNPPVIKVNSMHHQCVSSIDFPDCLEVLGIYVPTKAHRLSSIEVIRHKTLPVYAVQYHPEELTYEPLSDFIVEELIKKSKNYA